MKKRFFFFFTSSKKGNLVCFFITFLLKIYIYLFIWKIRECLKFLINIASEGGKKKKTHRKITEHSSL